MIGILVAIMITQLALLVLLFIAYINLHDALYIAISKLEELEKLS